MMKFNEIFTDENAVSPVIGVILMVAITVILAAVIATFVLGLGDQVSDTAPQASFGFDYDSANNNLTVTHTGGATITASNLNVTNGTKYGWATLSSKGSSSDVAAGDQAYIVAQSDDTVRVIWSNDEDTNSATLAEWEGPDA